MAGMSSVFRHALPPLAAASLPLEHSLSLEPMSANAGSRGEMQKLFCDVSFHSCYGSHPLTDRPALPISSQGSFTNLKNPQSESSVLGNWIAPKYCFRKTNILKQMQRVTPVKKSEPKGVREEERCSNATASLHPELDFAVQDGIELQAGDEVEFSVILNQRTGKCSAWHLSLVHGQRTRFKAFVAIGDYNGHVGLGVKGSKEVATAIRGAIILAKLSIVPVRRGYWGKNKIGKPHTVPCKVTGRCGSVLVRLIPAPRGTGIVSAPVPKKLLMMAGIDDCYTSARGCAATLGSFAKATFDAISKTYSYLTPDLWKETVFTKSPYQEFTDHLVKTHTRVSVQRTQAPAVATT
ncbi:LOW QUALITY PROTEIN: small ribosomal subunit protein uS5-like [Canis lupus baileyi]